MPPAQLRYSSSIFAVLMARHIWVDLILSLLCIFRVVMSGPAAFSRTRELACLRHDLQNGFFLEHIPGRLRRTE
jgi:hypothetical protein